MDFERGDLVEYNSPSWGLVRGTVLNVAGPRALCQDHAEHGAREWWPVAEIRLLERAPTRDEAEGLAWFNALTRAERLRWLQASADDTPAGAFAAYRKSAGSGGFAGSDDDGHHGGYR